MLTRNSPEDATELALAANIVATQNEPAEPLDVGRKTSISVLLLRGFLQIVLMLAVLFGSFLAMNKLIASKPEIRKKPGFKTVYTIKTMPVVLGDNRPIFTVYGQTIASRTVDLRSLVSGEVVSVNSSLKVGNKVAKGDALVEIDAFSYKGALLEAQANRSEVLARIKENKNRIILEQSKLQRLKEQLELTRKDHKRIAALRARGTVTQKQLDDRALALSQRAQAMEQSEINLQSERAKLEQQNAALQRLDWRVKLAQKNLENTTLVAPFNGIIRTASVEVGKSISANDVVVSIYEDKKIDVQFTLSDERYGRLQADTNNGDRGIFDRKINVIWAIGNKQHNYAAVIDRVGAEISSNRGGVEVFATLQQGVDTPVIRPGAFVEIRVPDILFMQTVVLPETSVFNGDTIYLRKGDKLESRKIEVLAYDNGSVIVSGELVNGDKVLTTRIAEISDGLRVREEANDTKG